MVTPKELAVLIIFGMFFILILSIGIIMLVRKNKKIQDLSAKLLKEEQAIKDFEKLEVAIATQEAERSQIARMLHDEIGGFLSIAYKNINIIESQSQKGVFELKAINLTKKFILESINQLREINKGLVPHYSLKFGLTKALERMSKQKTETLIESFQFKSTLPDNLVIEDSIMTHYFYIASELITNLLKHSYPTTIEMHLLYEAGILKLMIQHNGIALSQRDFQRLSEESDSLGLENISYRLKVIKGSILFKRLDAFGIIEMETKL